MDTLQSTRAPQAQVCFFDFCTPFTGYEPNAQLHGSQLLNLRSDSARACRCKPHSERAFKIQLQGTQQCETFLRVFWYPAMKVGCLILWSGGNAGTGKPDAHAARFGPGRHEQILLNVEVQDSSSTNRTTPRMAQCPRRNKEPAVRCFIEVRVCG